MVKRKKEVVESDSSEAEMSDSEEESVDLSSSSDEEKEEEKEEKDDELKMGVGKSTTKRGESTIATKRSPPAPPVQKKMKKKAVIDDSDDDFETTAKPKPAIKPMSGGEKSPKTRTAPAAKKGSAKKVSKSRRCVLDDSDDEPDGGGAGKAKANGPTNAVGESGSAWRVVTNNTTSVLEALPAVSRPNSGASQSMPMSKAQRSPKRSPKSSPKSTVAQMRKASVPLAATKPPQAGKALSPSTSSSSVLNPPAAPPGTVVAVHKAMNVSAMVSGGGGLCEDITKGDPISTENAAKKLIKKYMLQQNRPYSVIQVVDNLHKRMQKSTVERVLKMLVTEDVLRQKDYGKSSIFYPNQEFVANMLEEKCTPAALEKLNLQSRELTQEAQDLADREAALRNRAVQLAAEPTDVELDSALARARAEVTEKRARVAIVVGAGAVDPLAREKAVRVHNFYLKTWKTLKRKVQELAADVGESAGKKTKAVLEMFGVELDEDEGAVMPDPILEEQANRKPRGLTYRR